QTLVSKFRKISFTHMPHTKNQYADALATLASMISIPKEFDEWAVFVKLQDQPAYEKYEHSALFEISQIESAPDGKPWFYDLLNFL
ncbi:hypothetical protein DVA81_18990, partial [Acinetobacter baumannii]